MVLTFLYQTLYTGAVKRSTLVFIFLSGIASFFNYAVYPVLSRVLSTEQFVEVTVALALFTQLSSFMLAIVALTIGLSKQSSDKESRVVVEKLQAILAHVFILLIGLFIVSSPIFIHKIRLPVSLLFPIGLMLVLSLVMSIVSGYLNGKQKLVRLGFILALSSMLQFIACIWVGIATQDGVLALYAMSLASLLSVFGVYIFGRNDNLPSPSSVFLHKLSLYKDPGIRNLLVYTICAAVAALVINVLIIIDLLVISNRQADSVLYTDMYVISRIVFFAGMLLVWPFLSHLDIKKFNNNIRPFVKLVTLFVSLSIGAAAVMFVYGQQVLSFLLGSSYNQENLATLALLSIGYKLIYLVVTTLCLIFIVVRSYWAVTTPLIMAGLYGVIWLIPNQSWSSVEVLVWLNIIGLFGLCIALYGFFSLTYGHTARKVSPSRDLRN